MPVSAPAGFDTGQLTNVGGGGPSFLDKIPPAYQQTFLDGFHRAFSIALANSMWLGVGALAVAVISVSLLREQPLRHHFGAAEAEPVEEEAAHPGSKELAPGLD